MRDQVQTSCNISPVEMVSKAIGGVSPIGWLNPPAVTLIDTALADFEVVWAAAGHPHAVFPTTFAELKSVCNATAMEVGD